MQCREGYEAFDMTTIIGVRFRGSGKIYYFAPGELEIRSGMHLIVETSRGLEMGTAAGGIRQVNDEAVTQPLKAVIRIATEEDEEQARLNREREREAITICKEKIRKHELEMKLIDAEYTLDNSKILFYFTADGRVDFRELVKDLASVFRTRIELRQIGVRDETKILGGIGICGRPLCCSTWLTDFVPVSIRMAKEQNLSLSPSKISGVCGRLMCCLKNEEETYEYLNSLLPSVGEHVRTRTGLEGTVAGVNVLRQKVRVLLEVDDEKEIQEFDVSELIFQGKKKKGGKNTQNPQQAQAQGQAQAEEGNPESQEEVQAGRHEISSEDAFPEEEAAGPEETQPGDGAAKAPKNRKKRKQKGERREGPGGGQQEQPPRAEQPVREDHAGGGKKEPDAGDNPKPKKHRSKGNRKKENKGSPAPEGSAD